MPEGKSWTKLGKSDTGFRRERARENFDGGLVEPNSFSPMLIEVDSMGNY